MTGRENQNDTAASRLRAGAHPPATAGFGFQFLTFLLGLALVLAALGYGIFAERLASASATTIFEKTYTRTTGKPRPVVDSFTVANPAGDFTLSVRNGKEDGTQRVTSAVILLNGQLIVGPKNSTRRSRSSARPCRCRRKTRFPSRCAANRARFSRCPSWVGISTSRRWPTPARIRLSNPTSTRL